jgi:hypothetical protein
MTRKDKKDDILSSSFACQFKEGYAEKNLCKTYFNVVSHDKPLDIICGSMNLKM